MAPNNRKTKKQINTPRQIRFHSESGKISRPTRMLANTATGRAHRCNRNRFSPDGTGFPLIDVSEEYCSFRCYRAQLKNSVPHPSRKAGESEGHSSRKSSAESRRASRAPGQWVLLLTSSWRSLSPNVPEFGRWHGLSLGGAKCIIQNTTTNIIGTHTRIAASARVAPLAPSKKHMTPAMRSDAKI